MLSSVAIAAALSLNVMSAATAQTMAAPAGQPISAEQSPSATQPGNSMSTWMTDYSQNHQGLISREAYMAEAGRNWDYMDKNQRGLTTQQINAMYGNGSSAGTKGLVNDAAGAPMSKDKVTK